jgi:predicted ribosomally synthesized peptide with SipW-like signal peptide
MTTKKIARRRRLVLRRWILGVLGAGAVFAAASAGTFASFSASTSNTGNVFSTGKLELSNTKPGGTACVSGYTGTGTGAPSASLDANDNLGCDALMNLALRRPGDTAQGRLALANTGDYDGLLQFWLDGCTNSTVATPAGSGNLCDKLEVYVQEYDSTYSTPVASCVFPFDAGAACSSSWSAATDSLTDLATAATAASPEPATPIALAKSSTRYFQVSVRFASGGFDANGNGVDNQYQNRRAAFDLRWRLQEA